MRARVILRIDDLRDDAQLGGGAVHCERGNAPQSPDDANARSHTALVFRIDGVEQLRLRQRTLLSLAEVEPITVVAQPRFPGAPPRNTDAAWLRANDSLRLAFMEHSPVPTLPLSSDQAGLLPTAIETALGEARRNMAGLRDPHLYCLSLGPPGNLQPSSERLSSIRSIHQATVVSVTACDVDRGLGVWVLHPERRAWLVWVSGLTISGDTATALVGYHSEALMAAEWQCSFRRMGVDWQRRACTMRWVS